MANITDTPAWADVPQFLVDPTNWRLLGGDDAAPMNRQAAALAARTAFLRQITETIEAKQRGWVNFVTDLGGVADGVTDNGAAFLTANAQTRPVWFPDGTYLTSDTATFTSDQTWVTNGKVKFKCGFTAGSAARPMFNFLGRITSYGEFEIDHRAGELNLGMPTVYQGNPIAGSAVLVQGDLSSLEDWKCVNAWDNGFSAVKINDSTGKEVAGSPKYGTFRNLKTQHCGLGVHTNPQTPGKIGAGVDVASASAWTVSDCVDFQSYTGYILDIGAGAQAVFNNCIAFYTQVDTQNPLNGSGHGFYSGSSESAFNNCISIGSAYRGWRVDEVGTDFVNCMAYLSQQEGLFIKAGQFKGSFRLKGCGAKQANTYDAVLIDSSAVAITELELELHTTGVNHRWGVNAVGSKTIDAKVTGSVTGTTGIVNRQSYNIGTQIQNSAIGAGKRWAVNRDVPGFEWDLFGRHRVSADRANANSLTTLFGDTGGNGTRFVEDFANPSKRMADGWDPVNNAYVAQSIHAGTAKMPYWINPAGGEVMAGTGQFNEPLRLGGYRLWVDTNGVLRIKNGAPTSATDGTVVGTQTA